MSARAAPTAAAFHYQDLVLIFTFFARWRSSLHSYERAPSPSLEIVLVPGSKLLMLRADIAAENSRVRVASSSSSQEWAESRRLTSHHIPFRPCSCSSQGATATCCCCVASLQRDSDRGGGSGGGNGQFGCRPKYARGCTQTNLVGQWLVIVSEVISARA